MRFRDTRPEPTEPKTKPLTGSPEALGRLISLLPQGLPSGAVWRLPVKLRRKARWERTHRWSWRFRVKAAARAKERFGLDELLPNGDVNPETRLAMRRARKQEQRATR
jgi:hypothetical protein